MISAEEARVGAYRVAIIPLMKTQSLEILEKSQLPAAQAHAILKVMEMEVGAGHEALATKFDLLEVKSALKSDIVEVKAELKSDLADLKVELTGEIADLRTDGSSGVTVGGIIL